MGPQRSEKVPHLLDPKTLCILVWTQPYTPKHTIETRLNHYVLLFLGTHSIQLFILTSQKI